MQCLSAITLTTPAMLWGMAAVVLPILAHLLNRRVRRQVVFPTLRLLHEAAASQSRLLRLRRWFLLALRCIAVVLIAWAFARPVWTSTPQTSAGSTGGAAVVLVLDVSASIAQHEGGVALLDRMTGAAQRALDALEPGRDLANVVYAGHKPRAAYPRAVPNLDALRQELRGVRSTDGRADLAGAVALAASMLEEHQGLRRIVVLSDMQRTNWADQGIAPWQQDPSVELSIVPIGSAAAANTGIVRPSVFPARPIAGQPARLSAELIHFSDRSRTVELAATVNGHIVGRKSVTLAPGERQDISFEIVLPEPGPHQVVLSAGNDDLKLDDQVYLAVQAVGRTRIVLISDADPAQPTSAGYFIARALAPASDDSHQVEIVFLKSGELTNAALRGAEAVIVAEIGSLPEPSARALVGYIRSGGGVLMFLGEGPVSANIASLTAQAGGEPLVPFQPLQPIESVGGRPAPFLNDGAWNSPALRSFDELSRLALRQIAFYRTHTTSELRPGATPMLRFNDSTPALAVIGHGRGQMMLANFSPAPAHSDLAKHGAFVALLHGMIDELRGGSDGPASVIVGQPLTFDLPSTGATVEVVGPDGRPAPANTTQSKERVIVETAPADQPGFYQLRSDGRAVAAAAVNIDDRESDLGRISPEEFHVTASAADRPRPAGGAPSGGTPLWWWFVLGAAGAVAMEMLVLCLWRR